MVQRLTELIHTGKDEEVSFSSTFYENEDDEARKDILKYLSPPACKPFSFRFQRQSNASQTLCDIIRLSRDQANQMQENMEADPLLAVLES